MNAPLNRMQIMDVTGHTEITWDPTRPVEVSVAKSAFEKLMAERYSAFSVGEDGGRGTRINTFDPKAGKIMMVPQLVGG